MSRLLLIDTLANRRRPARDLRHAKLSNSFVGFEHAVADVPPWLDRALSGLGYEARPRACVVRE
jgi:hypothetical protein